jgi:hypothetical protein
MRNTATFWAAEMKQIDVSAKMKITVRLACMKESKDDMQRPAAPNTQKHVDLSMVSIVSHRLILPYNRDYTNADAEHHSRHGSTISPAVYVTL